MFRQSEWTSSSESRRQRAALDSDDDFHSGCRNVSRHHRQQSLSGLPSPRRSHYTIDNNWFIFNTNFCSAAGWCTRRGRHRRCRTSSKHSKCKQMEKDGCTNKTESCRGTHFCTVVCCWILQLNDKECSSCHGGWNKNSFGGGGLKNKHCWWWEHLWGLGGIFLWKMLKSSGSEMLIFAWNWGEGRGRGFYCPCMYRWRKHWSELEVCLYNVHKAFSCF